MSRSIDWSGSTWEIACRTLFAGDEVRMLDWGRRYLAATAEGRRRGFALGAEFRRIVGARNREQWWTTGVLLLEGRLGLRPGDARRDPTRRNPSRNRAAAAAPALAVREAEEPAAYGSCVSPPPRIAWPRLSPEERLRLFDQATERQRRRELGLPAFEPYAPPRERGWTRTEIYDRDRRR